MRRFGWLLVTLTLAGCKSPQATSPAGCFAQFNDAMGRSDYAAAAELIDFDAIAAAANPDWDSFPAGQRTQITARMRDDTEAGLRSMGYPAGGMTAGAPAVDGQDATVVATGGGKTLTLTLRQGQQGWRIVGGVPGMTTSSGMSGG